MGTRDGTGAVLIGVKDNGAGAKAERALRVRPVVDGVNGVHEVHGAGGVNDDAGNSRVRVCFAGEGLGAAAIDRDDDTPIPARALGVNVSLGSNGAGAVDVFSTARARCLNR